MILKSDDLYEIRAEGDVAWLELRMPANASAAAGARAAKEMVQFLVERVLVARSTFNGLVDDIRKGPSVVGPITRAELERLLSQAETVGKPLAVLVNPDSAMQRQQMSELRQRCAPRTAIVTDSENLARHWVLTAGRG